MANSEILRRETFAIGQAIFKAGDLPRCAYLIQSGSVAVLMQRDGKDVPLGELRAGDLLGEMALIDAQPRSATAVAKEPTTCVVLTPLEFQKRLETSDPFVRAMLRSLTGKLRKASAHSADAKKAEAQPAAPPPAAPVATPATKKAEPSSAH